MEKEDIEKIVRQVAAESDEKMQRYIGALSEDFQDKLDTVLEATQPIPQIQEKLNEVAEDVTVLKVKVSALEEGYRDLRETVNDMQPKVDATFEKVGEIAEDIESIKQVTENHEQRLQKVEIGQ